MSLLTILIVLLIVALLFGGFGTTRSYGYVGWSPAAIILIILLILLLTGNLNLG